MPKYECTACKDTGIHKLTKQTCPCRTGDIVEEPPKPKTFEEYVEGVQDINRKNIADSNCLVITVIQWQELKEIVTDLQTMIGNALATIEEMTKE